MRDSTSAFRRDLLPSWPGYAHAHGLELRGHGKQQRAACPIHGGSRDSLTINVFDGPWQCKSCGAEGGDVLAFHRQLHGLSFVEAARELGAWVPDGHPAAASQRQIAQAPQVRDIEDARQRSKVAQAVAILSASTPAVRSETARAYLLGRQCVLPPSDGDLYFHPDLQLYGFRGPALVGRMTLAAEAGATCGAHITWLELDRAGCWRRGERRYLGPKRGCVVRIWSDEAVTQGLGVAEGIETALSLAHAFTPVWACLDAGNLAAMPVLAGVESVLIAADHDDAGIAAADACGARWAAAGREASIVMPDSPKADLNDIARAA